LFHHETKISLLIDTTQYTEQCALINLLKTLGKTSVFCHVIGIVIHKYHVFAKDTRTHIYRTYNGNHSLHWNSTLHYEY